jgi:hypothetical protein
LIATRGRVIDGAAELVAPAAATAGYSEVNDAVDARRRAHVINKHLPAHYQDKRSWRHVAPELDKAVAGGDAADVAIALAWRCR